MAWLSLILNPLNLIGKVVDAVGAYFNKKTDADLEKYKVNGQVNIKAMETDLAVIQARADLAKVMKDDPASKWGRRLLIYPTGIWYVLIVWDSIARKHDILGEYRWEILALPANLDYIPYAVVAYLLVTAWRK